MRRIRVIPVLLINNNKLVKTINFKKETYVGDPINAIKIFNDKEVDELIIIDITATTEKRKPNLELIENMASECFMPLCYGGGISTIEEIKKIFNRGIEKISLNAGAIEFPDLITKAANYFGSQSIVASVDVKKNIFGNYYAYTHRGKKKISMQLLDYVKLLENMGAGELLLNSIERDGTYKGYDIELIKKITEVTNIPVIACGGASTIDDFLPAIHIGGASAVAAGSMFVFNGKHRAVLISYPSQNELVNKFYSQVFS